MKQRTQCVDICGLLPSFHPSHPPKQQPHFFRDPVLFLLYLVVWLDGNDVPTSAKSGPGWLKATVFPVLTVVIDLGET